MCRLLIYRKKFESIDLAQHKLPKGLAALEPLKSKTTIVQGLSGRCTGGGHSTWGGSLGQYRISGANLSPQNITIDYQLGQAIPGILPWVGVGMASGARDALMNITARAAHKTMPIILNPEKAYNSFFSVAAGGEREKNFHLKRNLLDYMVGDVKKTRKALGALAGEELLRFLDAALGRDDELAAWEEEIGHAAGLAQEPAGVGPQIEDDPARALVQEFLEALLHLARSHLVELGELDQADVAGEHVVEDGGDGDELAGDRDGHVLGGELEGGGVVALAPDVDGDARSWLTLETADDLVLGVPDRGPVVDAHDARLPSVEDRAGDETIRHALHANRDGGGEVP